MIGVEWGFGNGISNRTRAMPFAAAAQTWAWHWVWINRANKVGYFESKKDCFQVMAAAPYEYWVPVGFLWGAVGVSGVG